MRVGGVEYVILGTLARRPLTGYEIKQVVDHSTRFFWAASYGQIYPDLHPRLVLTATLLAVLLFEIVASREAAAFILELEDTGGAERGTDEERLEPVPGPG